MNKMPKHQDQKYLRLIHNQESQSLTQHLELLHELLKQKHPFIERISITLYDYKSDIVKTFIHSSHCGNPLSHYQIKLTDTPSLLNIYLHRTPRVIQDFGQIETGNNPHSNAFKKQSFRSSYTNAILRSEMLQGFIFFDSTEKEVFTANVIEDLERIKRLASFMIHSFQNTATTLLSTLKSAQKLAHIRDPETGLHIERVAYYSRLIAQKIAPKYHLTDEYIENVFIYSELHDIGKISIPDNILFKEGPLTKGEFIQIQSHSNKGYEIVNDIIDTTNLEGKNSTDILKNIVRYHHERLDGSGYPKGLMGSEIPLEALIVGVADIFDALTSKRPYKNAWSVTNAFKELSRMAENNLLDRDCVDALTHHHQEVSEIQQHFADPPTSH